jgi:hypothetical protein
MQCKVIAQYYTEVAEVFEMKKVEAIIREEKLERVKGFL